MSRCDNYLGHATHVTCRGVGRSSLRDTAEREKTMDSREGRGVRGMSGISVAPFKAAASSFARIATLESLQEHLQWAPAYVEVWDGDHDDIHPDREQVAHYYRFQELKLGRRYRRGDTPQSGPTGDTISIDWNGVRPMRIRCCARSLPAPPAPPARTSFASLSGRRMVERAGCVPVALPPDADLRDLPFALLTEREQVAVDEVGMRGGEAVREARIVDFNGPFDQPC